MFYVFHTLRLRQSSKKSHELWTIHHANSRYYARVGITSFFGVSGKLILCELCEKISEKEVEEIVKWRMGKVYKPQKCIKIDLQDAKHLSSSGMASVWKVRMHVYNKLEIDLHVQLYLSGV